jgi:lipopolysaccharide/colanic/teichoic acid biosynthesis glycosyltransferase
VGLGITTINGEIVHKEFAGHTGRLSLVTRVKDDRSAFPVWKRCLDLVLVLLVLPWILPVMLAVAILIKLVSKGPVFFRQERIGYLGKPFTCLKFRTMHVNADTSLHREHMGKLIANNLPLVKLDSKGDKRLIPFGAAIRAACLDEIPQLFNVLRGDMSLVGPRPCMEYEYTQLLPWHRQRFNTPPGMTGLWQVKRRLDTSFNQMMQMDLQYVANRAPGLDLMILLETVPAVWLQVRESRAAKRRMAEHSRTN